MAQHRTIKWNKLWKLFPWIILFLYPMRHVNWGLDLWDTGYNYANFQYMGLEHMDPMWLFSTYLSNAAGHFLTKLPGAGSLLGMNIYTGLFVSVLACLGYWFCTKKLQIPAWIAFVGEMLAISLCWCPTALLYNYLTYVLFLTCVILLYIGLVNQKMGCLFAAGVCLGANVLVRFSNLPEAALILAVWAYAVIEGLEEKKKIWPQIRRQTLWCLGGYLAALAVLFGYIHIRYGLDRYVEGIQRLFGMTENATDYKATSMVMALIGTYVENLYWVIRIVVIAGAGTAIWLVADQIAESDWLIKRCEHAKGWQTFRSLLKKGAVAVCVLLALAMLVWLYYRGFCSLAFYSYGPMLRPGVLFLMLTMGIAAVRIIYPGAAKEEKLISGLVILIVLLTSLGSNNKVYPSLNNLFVAAPYTLWECWKFMSLGKATLPWLGGKKAVISALQAKCVLVAFLAMCFFQFVGFGVGFSFVEATGAREVTDRVENNEILKGMKMHPDRARWMEEISAYAEEQGLMGREVILYGYIPSMSYYLQMPSAFNPWSDLRSYSLETMEKDLQEVVDDMDALTKEQQAEYPVVILENCYVQFLEGGAAALEALDLTEERRQEIVTDQKWQLLLRFMEEYDYEMTFCNEKFAVFE